MRYGINVCTCSILFYVLSKFRSKLFLVMFGRLLGHRPTPLFGSGTLPLLPTIRGSVPGVTSLGDVFAINNVPLLFSSRMDRQ